MPALSGHRILVVPARNEEAHLGDLLERVRNARVGLEVVVVDDGSHDRTAAIAARAGARVLRHPFNLGYAAALQTGYKYAYRKGATLVAQMDADGQHDPADLEVLIEGVDSGAADIVIGSRFLDDNTYRMGFARSAGRLLLQAVARSVGFSITDPTSGFQAMNRKVLSIYVNDLFPADYPDLDVLLLAHRVGIRIEERPVHMAPSPRRSSMHTGIAPIYYLYKTALSIWAGTAGFRPCPNGQNLEDDEKE